MDKLPEIILHISTYFVSAGIILATLRLIKGPTMADRAVALDTFTVISISLIVLIACIAGRVIFLDVGMVYAILSFIGVVAVARYIEGGL
ncbi:MAG: monovalent cation/H+ antiporter complex subunit F [Candidatus Delongbacteria bacterium]|nr:monovalent cation/H+ antiporter complex subunit F [Candidatus Delongbacteria bacterium]